MYSNFTYVWLYYYITKYIIEPRPIWLMKLSQCMKVILQNHTSEIWGLRSIKMSRHVTGTVKKSQFCKFDCNFVKTIPQHLSGLCPRPSGWRSNDMWIFSQTNNILLLNIFLNYNCRNNEQHSFLDQPSKTAQKVFLKVQIILYCQFNSAFHSVTQGGIFCVAMGKTIE